MLFHYAVLCGFSDGASGVRLYHTKNQAYDALDSNIDFAFGSGHVKLVQGNFSSPHDQGPIQQHGRAFLGIEVRFNEGHVEYRTS
jgi:hypothetical protein